MAAPNRKSVIERVLAEHEDLLIVPRKGNEEMRRMFLPEFIKAMPAEDHGRWGVLRKSSGTIPSDILVDRNTNDHFDVSTANEIDGDPDHYKIAAVWKNHGDISLRNKAWRWMDVEEANIPPLPTGDNNQPDPEPEPEPDGDTHRYDGGGNDTGICDRCGQPRQAAVHQVLESKKQHTYDGGEQDTGLCDICGQPRSGPLHGSAQPDPEPEPDDEPEPEPEPDDVTPDAIVAAIQAAAAQAHADTEALRIEFVAAAEKIAEAVKNVKIKF